LHALAGPRPGLRAIALLALLLTLAPAIRAAAAQEAPVASSPPGSAATESFAPDAGTGSRVLGPALELAVPSGGNGRGSAACSFHHPVCVQTGAGASPALVLATLAAADRAWATLTGALHLPPPDGDLDGRWRVVLVDRVDGGGTALATALDPRARFDRAASFGIVSRDVPPGCALDIALARAIARGSLWRSAPATDEGSARAETEALARLATACSPGAEDEALFQEQPERAIVDPTSAAFSRGASLFFEWIDDRFGREPGALIAGLWALAPTRTPPGASRWAGAPTGFDVLRVSLKDALWPGSTLDDVLGRFAVDRAVGISPWPPRLSWRVPWPATARRLASPVPPAPTGASYVLIARDAAPPGARLRLEAEWEDYGRMRWFAVKLDTAGKPIAELPIAALDKATHASVTVESLDATHDVLVVGVNVGSTEHAFDPDQGEWEPHGWLLTLEGE
jgi:hypothetical protein